MHLAFISILIVASLFDIFLHRNLGIAPMALFYVALKIQADRAAEIFLKYGLVKPEPQAEPSWMPPPESDPFAAMDSPRLEPPKQEQRAKRPEGEKAKSEQVKTARSTNHQRREAPPAERLKTGPFRAPKFHGAPHEVLGVEADANTNVIVKAFRHWIKEFHPDHLKPGQEVRRATERARTITTAKEHLLDRRRQMRKAA